MASYPFEALEHKHRAALGEQARRAAALGWASFVGAVFQLPLLLWVASHGLQGLGSMSLAFLFGWAVAMVPAAMAWVLAERTPRAGRPALRMPE